LYKKVLA